jgi:hypothetical protein
MDVVGPAVLRGLAMNVLLKPTYYSGLDLGQAHEFTALAIVERTIVESAKPALRHYAVRHLHRFALGTPYADLAAHVAMLFADPPVARSRLLVDQTMVGRPVVDELRRAKIQANMSALAITAGLHSGVGERGVLMVPKRELVSTMQVLLQSRRLTVASALAEAALLLEELANFKLTQPASRDDIADWREAPHDDLVFAVAIAVWQGERAPLSTVFKGTMVASPGCPGIDGLTRRFW